MTQHPAASLSIVIPYYDDLPEALRLAGRARNTIARDLLCQWILVQLHPSSIRPVRAPNFPDIEIICCESYSGLPSAKNLGLNASTGELVLYLFPGIEPGRGAIDRMADQLRRHPGWGAVPAFSAIIPVWQPLTMTVRPLSPAPRSGGPYCRLRANSASARTGIPAT